MADSDLDGVLTLRGEALLARLIEGFQQGDLLRREWAATDAEQATASWSPERQFRLAVADDAVHLIRWNSLTNGATAWMLTATAGGETVAKLESRDVTSPLVEFFSAVQESVDHPQRAVAAQRVLDAF